MDHMSSDCQLNYLNFYLARYSCRSLILETKTNVRRFADDVFKCIFLNENGWILIKISLKCVPKGPINNIPAFVQIMAWCHHHLNQWWPSSMTYICITWPQWVKSLVSERCGWRFIYAFFKLVLWISILITCHKIGYWGVPHNLI